MMNRVFNRSLMLACTVALALAGCGDDSPTNVRQDPPDVSNLPPGTPYNDTPANTMIRFEAAYENKALPEYEFMLTSNYRFTFSSQADPSLVAQYGDNWGELDEAQTTHHLFVGFENDNGDFVPGVAGITLALSGVQFVADPDHADSTTHYQLAIVPQVSLLFDVPGTDGYHIAAPHDFYLVRGDAAVLDVNQPADTTSWYIRRQVDKSTAFNVRVPAELAPARVLPASASTWGSVKAQYR